MKTIPLTKGKVALVDDSDFEKLSRYRWHADRSHNVWYAKRTVYFPVSQDRAAEFTTIGMHQQVLLWFEGIDHINHDGLDNRRENLRKTTMSQNIHNQQKRKNSTSQFRGVSFLKKTGKWKAEITVNYKRKYLGLFDTEIDAALAYDNEAVNSFKEHAQLNIPRERS